MYTVPYFVVNALYEWTMGTGYRTKMNYYPVL